MKNLSKFLLLPLFILLFTGCSKDEEELPAPSFDAELIKGRWETTIRRTEYFDSTGKLVDEFVVSAVNYFEFSDHIFSYQNAVVQVEHTTSYSLFNIDGKDYIEIGGSDGSAATQYEIVSITSNKMVWKREREEVNSKGAAWQVETTEMIRK